MSQHGRGKAEKSSASEVSFARNKLDGVLQTLMDKTEDSTDASDDDGTLFECDAFKESNVAARSSAKRSLGNKTPRKRKRKDDDNIRDLNNGLSTYVMKLFDRNVDLAKFNEATPLYPISRAWVYNDPFHGSSRTRFAPPTVEDDSAVLEEQDETKQNVYELPAPLNIKREDGKICDLRIPTCPIAEPTKFEIPTNDSFTPLTKDILMASNMARWKQVRQSWKEAAIANETRYKDSLSIIKSLKVVYE